MKDYVTDHAKEAGVVSTSRREILKGATALMAVPLVTGIPGLAQTIDTSVSTGSEPFPTTAYGVSKAAGPFSPMQIRRRALGPHDVLLDVLYCGICHSDIHHARGEWPTQFPVVPGHEIVGRVQAVGDKVTKFKVGDIGGVGCMVDSCGICENCLDDREQNCLKGSTLTYNSPDPAIGGQTIGGYSEKMVVTEKFVIRIPPGVDLAATAPLLCAGITTFSPMQHWKVGAGQRVGVIGLGGLGHVAVKLAASRRANVTVFTTSPGKISDAKRLGAKDAVLWSDSAAMKQLANQFDYIISTVPQAYPMQQFIDALKLDATLVNVGALDPLQGVSGGSLVFGRKSLAGSVIGGIAETQEVIDYCAARNIKADIELVRPVEIDKAYDRVVNKDVRYRFVIDLASTKDKITSRS